jgi:hypothetical protein
VNLTISLVCKGLRNVRYQRSRNKLRNLMVNKTPILAKCPTGQQCIHPQLAAKKVSGAVRTKNLQNTSDRRNLSRAAALGCYLVIDFLPHHGLGVDDRSWCLHAAPQCKCSLPTCTTRHRDDAKLLHLCAMVALLYHLPLGLCFRAQSHDAGWSLGRLPVSEMHAKVSNCPDLRNLNLLYRQF